MEGVNFNSDMSYSQARFLQSGNKLEQMKLNFINPNDQDHKKLKKAAQEFEAVFVQQLMDAMDKTVDKTDSILSGGSAEEYFKGMMNETVSQAMTQRPGGSGFGLAESIYRQMSEQIKPNPLSPKEGYAPDKIKMGSVNTKA
jgi:flagellar protein FlgJ